MEIQLHLHVNIVPTETLFTAVFVYAQKIWSTDKQYYKMDELIHSHLNSRSRFVHIAFIYANQNTAKSEKSVTKFKLCGAG